MKKLLVHLYFYFLNIILGNYFSYCKENFKFECEKKINDFQNDLIYSHLSPNFSPPNEDNSDEEMENDIESQEMEKIINPGEVQSLLFFNNYIYNLNLNLSNYNNNSLVIHFYPLDCIINIVKVDEKNTKFKLKTIKNYE